MIRFGFTGCAWHVVAAVVLVVVALLLASCSCPTQYLNDGSTGPGARPFYKLEHCKGKAPRVLCDSPNRLPNDDCK